MLSFTIHCPVSKTISHGNIKSDFGKIIKSPGTNSCGLAPCSMFSERKLRLTIFTLSHFDVSTKSRSATTC